MEMPIVISPLWEGGEESGASMSTSWVVVEVEVMPLILKIADSLPGPMPPRNLKLG